MDTHALFNHNYASTCFQHTNKGNKIWLHTLPIALFKIVLTSFYLWPHFTCPNTMTTFWYGILLNTFLASSMLPHFAYMSTMLVPTKIFESHPLWMICSWANLPFSSLSVTMLAHAFNTPIKVTTFGYTSLYCIRWNNSNAFYPSPHFTCPHIIMAIQVTTFWNGILLSTIQVSSMFPHFAYMSTKLLDTKTLDS